jgi:hypothetical protein
MRAYVVGRIVWVGGHVVENNGCEGTMFIVDLVSVAEH